MSLHNIFEHFRNALFQFYDVNPYPDDLTFKVGDRRLIISLPFDQHNETLFGLLFQHFFLSCHRSLYWGYLVCYDHHQDEVYFCEVHFHINLPLAARKYVNTIAEGIARVGFLTMKTALIPGAVQAWIDAVVFAAEAPAPPTLGYEELRFFTFTPQMGRWLSRTPLAYSPLVCDLYYLYRLQQDAAWRYSLHRALRSLPALLVFTAVMAPIRTIEDHFCNLLFKLFKHWPYYKDYSRSIPERRLITRIPLDQEREALLGLLLQHSFLSRRISLYWGFVACIDIWQAPIYFYHDLLSDDPPYEAQAIIDMVAEAIARVGFLHSHTASLPGAVDAWIDSVIGCMEDPPPSKLEPQRLFFFEYHPLMVCDLYYLDRLQQDAAWRYSDSEVDVPPVIPWYDHLDDTVLPSLFHLDA
ncbi:hypothetical protein PQX77_021734 [Marasmius sp. AFHP31]|nr:hypothetical protein PQX77_021734 [Marasmius sp. AFHP31]